MASKYNRLKKYLSKRDFEITSEPKSNQDYFRIKQLFVIQKHDSRKLHYDIRFEDNGVLKSWAVPKGPSSNPADKRLAIQTEDHPYDYAYFEGVIPENNYGAGPVLLWDRGVYYNLREPLSFDQCINEGKIEIWFDGYKLKGKYVLVRLKAVENNWLLIKMNDEYVDRKHSITQDMPLSIESGKTIEQLKKKKDS